MKENSLRELAGWACGLRLGDIPRSVRERAVDQVLSTLAAVYSGWESDLGPGLERAYHPPAAGPARIIPTGAAAPASHAAMLMASWSMVLDFDDVMLGGHTGHSSVLTPLAIGSMGQTSGADLLVAQIVANEIAARINMVCAVGATRGQMATHLHLLAASAARAKLEALDEDRFAEALGLALSYPSQALFPAFMGSDAKALCASLAVRVGMEAVDAAREGLRAAVGLLDEKKGFFATHARVPVREFLGGLGKRWHTETNSFKIYPVCGYVCSALDATLELVHSHEIPPGDVAAVDVWASMFTVGMDAHSAPYLDGPRSRVSTLTFSTPFTIASAILAREFTPEQLKRSWIEKPEVWQLAARVRSRHDFELTQRALTADIPIGAALRRTRPWQAGAFAWSAAGSALGKRDRWRNPDTYRLIARLAAVAGDSSPLDFSKSTKPLGAHVEIHLSDGRTLGSAVSIPQGFAGASTGEGKPTVRDLMRRKFVNAAAAAIGHDQAQEMSDFLERLEDLSAAEVSHLFEIGRVRAHAGVA